MVRAWERETPVARVETQQVADVVTGEDAVDLEVTEATEPAVKAKLEYASIGKTLVPVGLEITASIDTKVAATPQAVTVAAIRLSQRL